MIDDPLPLCSNPGNTAEPLFFSIVIQYCPVPQIFILASLSRQEYGSMLEILAKKIPVLPRMAVDLLSKPAMPSEAEHVFAAQKTVHHGRCPLVQCLKLWFQARYYTQEDQYEGLRQQQKAERQELNDTELEQKVCGTASKEYTLVILTD